jgi:hypothetical protein
MVVNGVLLSFNYYFLLQSSSYEKGLSKLQSVVANYY